MITESVFDPRDARGDLGELKHLAHAPVMTEHGLADACLRESEEGELVVLVEFGVAPSAGAMALFAMALKDERRAHFMLRAPSFAEDFAKDFDEATEGVHKITLVLPYPPDPEIEIAVEAIPLRELQEAVGVQISVSEQDFELLFRRSGEPERIWLERLVPLDDMELISDAWARLYFFHPVWANVKLAMAFLDAHGHPYQVARDAEDSEFAILTNFVSAHEEQRMARYKLREAMQRERKIPTDEELAALFHMAEHATSEPEPREVAPAPAEEPPSPTRPVRRMEALRRRGAKLRRKRPKSE